MQFAEIKPVRVRAVLALTRVGKYASFWLQPQVWSDFYQSWQGGEELQVKRLGENEFKIGALEAISLEQAACLVEDYLRRYRVPFIGEEPWEHPFTYHI